MRSIAVLLLAASLAGCKYGFSGGGLPSNVRTIAIIPFDNQTPSADLPRELTEALSEGLERRLGLRQVPEERAHAVVRGKITRYELDIPATVSSDRTQVTSSRRRLSIGVDIEMVRQSDGRVLWTRTGLSSEGEYAERGEALGRKQAIERIVAEVIEGAQSQW